MKSNEKAKNRTLWIFQSLRAERTWENRKKNETLSRRHKLEKKSSKESEGVFRSLRRCLLTEYRRVLSAFVVLWHCAEPESVSPSSFLTIAKERPPFFQGQGRNPEASETSLASSLQFFPLSSPLTLRLIEICIVQLGLLFIFIYSSILENCLKFLSAVCIASAL